MISAHIKCVIYLWSFIFRFTSCLYEDQIGKFDWVQRYVGEVEHAVFEASNVPARRLIVSSRQNVIAALSTKNGELLWRHVLEESESAHIKLLEVVESRVTAVSSQLLRSWDVTTAALLEEIRFDYLPTTGMVETLIALKDEEVWLVELCVGSVTVSVFDRVTGTLFNKRTIRADWMQKTSSCISSNKMLLCVDVSRKKLFSLQLSSSVSSIVEEEANGEEESTQQKPSIDTFTSYDLSLFGMTVSSSVADEAVKLLPTGNEGSVVLQIGSKKKLLSVGLSSTQMLIDLSDATMVSSCSEDFTYVITQSGRQLTVTSVGTKTQSTIDKEKFSVDLPMQTGHVVGFMTNRFKRKDGSFGVRAFVTCSDHSVHFVSSSGLIWTREESVASVLAVQAVDLPVDEGSVNYPTGLSAGIGIVFSFVQRLQTQWAHMYSWMVTLLGKADFYQDSQITLIRDRFNLRKLLVLATSSGKILAIDSFSGEVIWSLYISALAPLKEDKLVMFTQRSTAHFPLRAQCVVVGKDMVTGNGLLVVFDPITGENTEEHGIIHLSYRLLYFTMLHHHDENFVKPLLLVDHSLAGHVFPSASESVILQHKGSIYVYLTGEEGALKGYTLRFSKPGAVILSETWKVSLGNGVITGIHGKSPVEQVHSPGRVLADRSVLYKYVNPNLIVVTTQAYDHTNKNTLNVYLIDAITGAIIDSVSHKRTSGPVHVVHSENWVVYSNCNDKYRRFEITSLELFEGLTQSNATAFSSFGLPPTPPIMERQAFIMPIAIQSVAHTVTEKGITTKFLLFALQSGSLVQMSRYFLDPRRPISQSMITYEEMLVPYMPELPLVEQEMINYNNSLPKVTGIHTAPTGLESACVVLVYGLDLFSTRVFPSKMFDVLQEDFDHFLILGALLALFIAALATRRLSQRKALNQAWK